MVENIQKPIYFDHASTTPLNKDVLQDMLPYLTTIYGNASSLHSIGRDAVKGLDEARDKIAKIINAKADEIYFTSGGTESNNWAIKGSFLARGNKNKIVTTTIEHPAVLNAINSLKDFNIEIVKIPPKANGIVSVEDFSKAIDENTFLTCCMFANNEIGTIEPIKEICKIAKNKGSLFFTDAVQYIGHNEIDVKNLNVDMLSASAHKFNGPKGVGFLYIKNSIKLKTLLNGGHQERNRRGGTSNVAGAIGMAKALELTRINLDKDSDYVLNLKNTFINRVLNEIDIAFLNGDKTMRLQNNANITFKGIDGDNLLYLLDLNGICASTCSACSAGSIEPSYVLTEIGLSEKDAKSSIRFTFSKENTLSEVNYCVDTLKNIISSLKK